MTELEWLKQESGMSDDELKTYETLLGNGKFKVMLAKLQATKIQSAEALTKAENERLQLDKDWNEKYVPELQRTTTDSLNAQGEVARLKAELAAAKEYGIVPNSVKPLEPTVPPARAPGSPDPQYATRDDYAKLRGDVSTMAIRISDLNGRHFKLFGAPLDDAQALVEEYQRESQLGHNPTIDSIWERKYNVAAKREEIRAGEQKKHDDEIRAAALADYKTKYGTQPNTRVGQPSRFSSYDPKDKGGSDGPKPWKVAPGMKKTANKPLHDWAVQKLATATKQ